MKFLKLSLVVGIFLMAMISLEFWFRVFVLGRQYETAPLYQSFFYILAPIAVIAVASWSIWRIAKAKFDFS